MKKYLLLILATPLLIGWTIDGMDSPTTIDGMTGFTTVDGMAVDNYSDITFWWRCEGTTLDGSDDHTNGEDSTATLASSAAINTDAVKIGTNGLDCPSADDRAEFTDSTDGMLDPESFRVGMWVYINSWPTNYDGVFVRKDSGAADIYLNYRYTEHTLRLNYGAVLATTTATLSLSTWYFVEYAAELSSDTLKIYIDGVERASSSASLSTPTAGGYVRIGEGVGADGDFYIDNVIISNDITRDLYALRNVTAYSNL